MLMGVVLEVLHLLDVEPLHVDIDIATIFTWRECSGVSQHSVPILFDIFINDLEEGIENFKMKPSWDA